LCIEINDKTWVIGNYIIKNQGSHAYSVSAESKKLHTFYSRSAAIFYCALTSLQKFNLADRILLADQETSRRYDDTEFYRNKLNDSKIKLGDFKKLLYTTRYHESKLRLTNARLELEESLETAKYNKIWENLL
jgi:hypothetical protein